MVKEFERWSIQEQEHYLCYYLESGWCNNKKVKCEWNICNLRVEGSRVMTDNYGNILRSL